MKKGEIPLRILALVLCFATSTSAVPPLDPKIFPNAVGKTCNVPPLPAELVKHYGVRGAMRTHGTGTKKVAVLLVSFSSADDTTSGPSNGVFTQFANAKSYFDSVANYYNENSYGQLTLQFTYFPNDTTGTPSTAIALAGTMQQYGCGDEFTCGGATPLGDELIRDALQAAPARASSTNFDAVIVMHAGTGNETTSKTGDIWSITYTGSSKITAASRGFSSGLVVPEFESSSIASPMGVIAHECGHLLLSLPDLYNTLVSGGNSVVGNWDLMDSGPYLGPTGNKGANPAHLGAWCKNEAGWLSLTTVTSTQSSFTFKNVEKNRDGVVKIPVTNGLSNELFLIEYRFRSSGASFDQNIPGDGLMVWHIDQDLATSRTASNTVNTASPRNAVSLVTANGATISNSNQGSASNAFSNGQNFTDPQSNNFNGTSTGISVLNIAGVSGANATSDITNLASAASQSITKLINFPNPAGTGYPHPSGEGHTTLQFQARKVAKDFSIQIYDLAGQLVRKIPKDIIRLNISRSADEKWVYEYDWDGTNQDGIHVQPGVYLYLVRVDGEKQVGKAVYIR